MSEPAPLLPGQMLVGATKSADGRLDTSRAMVMYPELPPFGEKDPPIPQHWTTLIHGTNTARHRGNPSLIAAPTYTISTEPARSGMSCITAEERDKSQGHSDTSAGYASMRSSGGTVGEAVEINVVFPEFHARRMGLQAIVDEYTLKYGDEATKRIVNLANQTYWNNEQTGRHPLLPKGMVLIKLADRTKNGVRQLFYIPQQLQEVYQHELQQAA